MSSTKRFFPALVLVLLATVVQADPPKDPPKELLRLHRLTGVWKGSAILIVGNDTTVFPITLKFRTLISGNAMLAEFQDQRTSGDEFQRASLIGYEATTGNIHMLSVTNSGDTQVFTGMWLNDQKNTLQMKHIGGSGLVEIRKDLIIVAASNREVLIREIVTQNNKHESTFEARLRK